MALRRCDEDTQHNVAPYRRGQEGDGPIPAVVRTTVVVTNYNYGYYLDRCLRSLVEQTDQNFQIVVVDDSSTDYSHEILDLWEGMDGLTILRNRKNIGLGASCNVAIRQARTRYVVRVDADDFVCSEYVYMLSRFLDHNPTVDAVVCDYYEVDGDYKRAFVDAIEHPIACGILFRSEVLWAIGMYSTDRTVREDIDLMQRFDLGRYRKGHLSVPLYRYHRKAGSLSDQLDARDRPSPPLGEREETTPAG